MQLKSEKTHTNKHRRKARKSFEYDPTQDANGMGIADIKYEHIGKRLSEHVEKPKSALERLQDRPGTDLLGVWRKDPTPTHPLGTDKCAASPAHKRRVTAATPTKIAGLSVLVEHSRNQFRTYNDKRRVIGSLPLNERLFMFYKRTDRRMLAYLPEVVRFWADDERTLEKVLKHKYHTSLSEQGLG